MKKNSGTVGTSSKSSAMSSMTCSIFFSSRSVLVGGCTSDGGRGFGVTIESSSVTGLSGGVIGRDGLGRDGCSGLEGFVGLGRGRSGLVGLGLISIFSAVGVSSVEVIV